MKYVTERNHTVYILSEIPIRKSKVKEWVITDWPIKKWTNKPYRRKFVTWQEAEKITGVAVPEQLELGL
jgi:hypothetical protein